MKKIMKNLKKIPAYIMLVLSIVMSVPTNVFALDIATDKGTATVTVNGVDEKYSEVTANAYRIIDINIEKGQPAAPVYVWRSEVLPWISANYPEFIKTGTTNVVDATFCATSSDPNVTCVDATKLATFYDALAAAIRDTNENINSGSKLNPDFTGTNAEGVVTISNMTMGNYLVLIEGGMNVYKPSAVNIVPKYVNDAWVVNDVTVNVKSTAPTIVKTIEDEKTNQAQVGDTRNFKIKVLIPEYPENAIAKQIEISDLFDLGLTLDTNSIVVKANTSDDFEHADELVKGTNYTLTTGKVDGKDTFKVVIDTDQNSLLFKMVGEGEAAVKTPYRYIYVTYKGTINTNAVVTECTTETDEETGEEVEVCTANKNTANLKYNNNPYDSTSWEDEPTDKVTIYTYGIKLDKIADEEDGNGNTVYLPGAKFTVADEDGNLINFIADPENEGTYIKAITADEASQNSSLTATPQADLVKAGELEVSSEGHLVLKGLAVGTYTITEVEAPEGYIKLQEAFEITIADSDEDGKAENEDGTEFNDGYVFEEVPNSNDMPILPITGGIGTILFSVIGIMFMGLGVFLIKNIFKKEEQQ